MLSLILTLQLSDESWDSHTRSGVSRTHLRSSLDNGTRANLKDCTLGRGAGSRNRLIQPVGTVDPMGRSNCCMETAVMGTGGETHTDACGKIIRSPFLSLATV